MVVVVVDLAYDVDAHDRGLVRLPLVLLHGLGDRDRGGGGRRRRLLNARDADGLDLASVGAADSAGGPKYTRSVGMMR